MAYFNQEMKQKMAPKIKNVLKKYNMKGFLSVDKSDTVILNVKSGTIDFDSTNTLLMNPRYVDKFYSGIAKDFLNEVSAILHDENFCESDIQSDYFNIDWYVEIRIGRWNKPYLLTV